MADLFSRRRHLLKAIDFCILFTGLYVLIYFVKSLVDERSGRVTHAIIGIVVAGVLTILFLKIEKRTFADIGLSFHRTTIKKFFTGVLLGLVLMGILSGAVIYFSGFSVEVNKASGLLHFLWATVPLLPLAFMEELGFRAYPLEILKNKTGPGNSIILTSVLFALYHMANGWTIQDSFLGAGVWGLLFGLAAVYSGGISMPTGLHYAVNLTTSAFGITADAPAIWLLKQKNGSTLENYQSTQWETLIPQLSLLLFAVFCMYVYLRKYSARVVPAATLGVKENGPGH